MESENFKIVYGYKPEWLGDMLSVYNKTELKRSEGAAARVSKAFSNSQVVASIWKGPRLVAIGRMITDFEMYSAIFDVVVDPDFQKNGLGRQIMWALIETVPGTCIYLTSTFGNEPFYHKQGFRFHKSAMALYPESFGKTPYLDWDRLPEA